MFRWAVIKDFVDVFNNLSAPYLLAEGSLLNFHRNFSTGKADVDFSLELGWWNQSDHKSKLASLLTEKGLWHYDTFGKFGEVLIRIYIVVETKVWWDMNLICRILSGWV